MVHGLYLNQDVFKKHKEGLNNYLGLDFLFGDVIIYCTNQIHLKSTETLFFIM